MGFWVLAAVAALAMLVVVVGALRSGAVEERARPAPPPSGLPHPDELADPVFPLAWQGYAPDHVDAWVTRVHHAYATAWRELQSDSHSDQEVEDGGGDGPGVLDR